MSRFKPGDAVIVIRACVNPQHLGKIGQVENELHPANILGLGIVKPGDPAHTVVLASGSRVAYPPSWIVPLFPDAATLRDELRVEEVERDG